jgi:hypothetical protein
MNLFEYASTKCKVHPEILGYYYMNNLTPNKLNELNKSDFVFISSDFAVPILGCTAKQFMTSAEYPDSYMWLLQDYSSLSQFPASELTDIPTIGFVGRCPVFRMPDGSNQLHRGFKPRYKALQALMQSNDICTDFHIRSDPAGDSCGFWNTSLPNYKRDGPLFKTNMLANQYQVCARGNANWSLRFFETLAYGRIPVYVESGE